MNVAFWKHKVREWRLNLMSCAQSNFKTTWPPNCTWIVMHGLHHCKVFTDGLVLGGKEVLTWACAVMPGLSLWCVDIHSNPAQLNCPQTRSQTSLSTNRQSWSIHWHSDISGQSHLKCKGHLWYSWSFIVFPVQSLGSLWSLALLDWSVYCYGVQHHWAGWSFTHWNGPSSCTSSVFLMHPQLPAYNQASCAVEGCICHPLSFQSSDPSPQTWLHHLRPVQSVLLLGLRPFSAVLLDQPCKMFSTAFT